MGEREEEGWFGGGGGEGGWFEGGGVLVWGEGRVGLGNNNTRSLISSPNQR